MPDYENGRAGHDPGTAGALPFQHDGQNTYAFPNYSEMFSPSRKNIYLFERRNF
jgi:hypothetical protein